MDNKTILGNDKIVCKYTNLKDACDPQEHYNVFGVVINFVKPRKLKSDKGSHKYYTSITIIDPTLPTCSDSVAVNLFSSEIELLPDLIRIGSIVRIHKVSFKTFNGARQLTGALYSNPKNGRGASILQCYRKTKDLTGIPLYYAHESESASAKSRHQPLEEQVEVEVGSGTTSTTNEKDNISSIISYPVTGINNNRNEYQAGGGGNDNINDNANDNANEAPMGGIITIDKKSGYYYYDPEEWCIINKNRYQTNSFTVKDKRILVQYSLWSQVLLMAHLNLHDCINQQEGIASTLYEAYKWEFTNYEGLNNNNMNNPNPNPNPNSRFKMPRYDCICMVGYVRNTTTTGNSNNNKQACLYIYDGTGSDVHDNMTEKCYQTGHVLTLPKGDEEFIGPKTFQKIVNRIYLSMKNAALYSETRTLEDRMHLETDLEQGLSIDDTEQDGNGIDIANQSSSKKHQIERPQVMFGHLYSVSCFGDDERNYLDKMNLQPGTWLRIRNLHTTTSVSAPTNTNATSTPLDDEVACIGIIMEDTTIAIIDPSCQNVSKCAAAHFHRLLEKQKYPLMAKNAKSKAASANGTRAMSNSVNTNNSNTNSNVNNRIYISPRGVSYCPLASCLSSTPPGEFCVRARIKWYSPQFVRLIETENAVHQTRNSKAKIVTTKVPTYMFTLHLADDSAETDVIVYDKEGQYFLGGSKGPNATKFIGNEKLQENAESLLKHHISNLTFLDFYLWTYKVQVKSSMDANEMDENIGVLTSSYDDVENNSVANNEYARKHRYVTRVKLVHTTLVSDSK